MSEATLSRVQEMLLRIAEFFSRLSGIGYWLFLAGFTLLLILIGVLVIKVLVYALKIIPNLTIGQFIKLLLVIAVVLIVVGLFIP